MMRSSFESRLIATKGNASGFDYLRIGLALGVLCWHCYAVSAYEESNRLFWAGPLRAFPAAILPMFFALSGFLVAGSLERTRLHQFALLRVLRIVPALAFETVLVALVLGPTFTVLALPTYFASPEFHAYFLNVVGYIHYTLPGVFEGRMLNAQLWTIPSELECYLALIALAALGLTRRRSIFGAGLVLGALCLTVFSIGAGIESPYAQLGGRVLVFSFLAGVLAFLYRNAIPHDGRLFAVSVILSGVLLSYRETSYLAAFPAAYATAWLGLLRLPRIPFGDLSYGVFLFHFPIIQVVQHLGGSDMSCLEYIAVVIPVSVACAALSWTLIERPILANKRRIVQTIEAFGSGSLRGLLAAGRSVVGRA